MKKTILAAALLASAIGAAQAQATSSQVTSSLIGAGLGAGQADVLGHLVVTSQPAYCAGAAEIILGGTCPTPAAAPGVAGPDVRALGFAGRGIAELSALQAPTTFGPNGLGVAVGVGSYAGYGAIGASVAQQFHIAGHPAAFSIGGAMSGSGAQPVLHAGFSLGF